MEAYIRPCAAFPDGLEIPFDLAEELLADDLIESAYGWAENATEDDYAAIYSEETIDEIIFDIEERLRNWHAPWNTK